MSFSSPSLLLHLWSSFQLLAACLTKPSAPAYLAILSNPGSGSALVHSTKSNRLYNARNASRVSSCGTSASHRFPGQNPGGAGQQYVAVSLTDQETEL